MGLAPTTNPPCVLPSYCNQIPDGQLGGGKATLDDRAQSIISGNARWQAASHESQGKEAGWTDIEARLLTLKAHTLQ